ncbi:MAG: gluzincin family metallopeptidase [Deltaproteobacteria bacterium]
MSQAKLTDEVAALRAEARALVLAQSELAWRNWVYGDPINLAATYVGHERLFSKESIAKVTALWGETQAPAERRALGYFRLYLAGELIGRAVAPLSDEAQNLEAEATFVTPSGAEQPYRELNRLLANEQGYALRGQLSDAALSVVRKLNPILEAKEQKTQALLSSLGYPSYAAFGAELREADLGALAALADRVLTDTEPVYRAAMAREVSSTLGLTLAGMRRADIPRFNRGANLDAYFPADQMIPRLTATLRGLGFDLPQQKAIRIDDSPLPKKNPRAVCFPLVVPTDIRLSVKPLGGVSDYQALFHETGHAEHYANTTVTTWELQQLGDGAATEAYAFVLEDLVDDPRWLEETVGLSGDKLRAYVRGAAVRKLYLLRRYAGKLRFEIGWHGGAPEPKRLYREELTRAYGFPVSESDAERYLVDHDDFFYSADYFRAWFLAAQIEEKLAQKFGPSWWHERAAGAYLASLWKWGNEKGVEEIARELGDPGLRTEPLLAKLEAALGGP